MFPFLNESVLNMSTKKPEKQERRSITILSSYKKKIDRVSNELSLEFDERITTTEIVYMLVDDHLDEVKEKLRKKYSEDIF